jgi:Cu/Ag efflux pump CusA
LRLSWALCHRGLPEAQGAGRAVRISVGITVFGGMIAATTLNLLFIPVPYVIVRSVVPGPEPQTSELK